MSLTDWLRKGTGFSPATPFTTKPLRVSPAYSLPWSRVDREPPLEEAHPVNGCKSRRSECLCIHEPEGMSNRCPDTVLQRPRASSVRVRICGVGPPSATSEVHTGDGATRQQGRVLLWRLSAPHSMMEPTPWLLFSLSQLRNAGSPWRLHTRRPRLLL